MGSPVLGVQVAQLQGIHSLVIRAVSQTLPSPGLASHDTEGAVRAVRPSIHHARPSITVITSCTYDCNLPSRIGDIPIRASSRMAVASMRKPAQ